MKTLTAMKRTIATRYPMRHKLYCPECAGFVPADVDFVDGLAVITCSGCGSSEKFVNVENFGYMPEEMLRIIDLDLKLRILEVRRARR